MLCMIVINCANVLGQMVILSGHEVRPLVESVRQGRSVRMCSSVGLRRPFFFYHSLSLAYPGDIAFYRYRSLSLAYPCDIGLYRSLSLAYPGDIALYRSLSLAYSGDIALYRRGSSVLPASAASFHRLLFDRQASRLAFTFLRHFFLRCFYFFSLLKAYYLS